MRGVLTRALAAVLGLGVAFGMVELALPHVIDRGVCHGQSPMWRPDADVGWALVPNAERDVFVCDARGRAEARHHVTINALGLRDRPRGPARETSRPRVLVLGDSYVEALQVDLEETFLARLERVLGIEMINAGVSGYSTDNELRAFTRYSDRVRPDGVLLVLFVGNDVVENGPRLFLKNPHGLPPKPWLGLGEGPGTLALCYAVARRTAAVADHVPDLLWTTSRLLRWTLTGGVGAALSAGCRDATGPPLIPGQLELFGVYGRPQTVAWEEAWAVTERTLHDLVTRVRDADMQVGIVLAPWQVEYDPSALLRPFFPPAAGGAWDYGYPYARLGALLTTWSVPWVSLEPALASHYAATGRSGAYAWDGHWNAEGHAVVADALEPFVTTLVGDRR